MIFEKALSLERPSFYQKGIFMSNSLFFQNPNDNMVVSL